MSEYAYTGKYADERDEAVQTSTPEIRETDEWKCVHQPWALDTEEKKMAAYKELLCCDYVPIIMGARGAKEIFAEHPQYSKMMIELKTNPMALEKFILGGHCCGMQAMAALSLNLLRRRKLPKNKPEKEPESAAEAKEYATKLFSAKKFAHAADQYALAIRLVDARPSVLVEVRTGSGATPAAAEEEDDGPVLEEVTDTPTGDSAQQQPPAADDGRLVRLSLSAKPQEKIDERTMLPALHANLAACRVKQHRWAEAISACDAALLLKPGYTCLLYTSPSPRDS